MNGQLIDWVFGMDDDGQSVNGYNMLNRLDAIFSCLFLLVVLHGPGRVGDIHIPIDQGSDTCS